MNHWHLQNQWFVFDEHVLYRYEKNENTIIKHIIDEPVDQELKIYNCFLKIKD